MPPNGLVVVLHHEGRLRSARRMLGETAGAQNQWDQQQYETFHGKSPGGGFQISDFSIAWLPFYSASATRRTKQSRQARLRQSPYRTDENTCPVDASSHLASCPARLVPGTM